MEHTTTTTQTVTPWEVEGTVDYDKLLREFGVQTISKESREYLQELAEKKGLQNHLFLRRELFFAQMDLDKVLKAHSEGKSVFLYTGRSPGGSMHIGHLVPFLFTKFLQEILECNLYIQIPDDEKFLFKQDLTLDKIEEMVELDLQEIAAIGFDPEKTFIFRNSQFIAQMYPLLLKTAKKITYSQARNTFGFEGHSNIGQVFYPALQIVPTFFEKGYCLIPCAIDQNPYFLLQRDFAKKLGFKKNATILSKFLTALTGPQGKMSASDPQKAILLTDTPKQIKKKINKHAFSGGRSSLEEHKKWGGRCEIDVSYQWLYYLFEEDDKKIEEIRNSYSSGELLSGELKALLIEKVQELVKTHSHKREKAAQEDLLKKYMYAGTLAQQMWNKKF